MSDGITITSENIHAIIENLRRVLQELPKYPPFEPMWKGVPLSMLTDAQQDEYENWCVANNRLYIRHPHRKHDQRP